MISEQIYILALSFIKGIGDNRLKFLIEKLGSAENVWKEHSNHLNKINAIPSNIVNEIGNSKYLKKAENELEFCLKNNIDLHFYQQNSYPDLLKECDDCPTILFTKGNLNLNFKKKISIVGTRKMTNYGRNFIEQLIENLKDYDLTIVSGLAYGCDIFSHELAIQHHLETWAVLAHHLNHIYPSSHKNIAEKMLENGGWISEQPSFKEINPNFFLQRNRIIAGLSEITILVESAKHGGSLVTAKFANDYNRNVLALAGRNTDTYSKGCNYLIKTHQAYLIDDPNDVLYYLDLNKKNTSPQLEIFHELNPDELKIYNHIQSNGKTHIDALSIALNMMTYQLMPTLLDLELKQIIKPMPGKYFDLQN